MEYTYDKGDLTKNPQKYQKSEFHGNEFLIAYKESRIKVLKKIEKIIENKVIDNLEQEEIENNDEIDSDTIDLERLLNEILTSKNYERNDVIDILLKKIEIKKKIIKRYNLEFKELDDEKYYLKNYIYLSNLLMIKYDKTENLKFLNTLLKINDIICSQIEKYDEILNIKKFFEILNNEIIYIEKLFLKKGIKLKWK